MLRHLVLASVAAGALVVAAPALAAPTLSVSHARPSLDTQGDVTLVLALDQAPAPPIVQSTVYVPEGEVLRMRRTIGNAIGSATGTVDAGAGPIAVTGAITSANPGDHLGDACTPGPHAAVWHLRLIGAGVDQTIPLYLNETVGIEQTLGAYRLHVCFAATPRVTALTLTLDDAVRTPARKGRTTWRAILSPAALDGSADTAAAVEARALVSLPVEVELAGEHDFVSGKARLEGRIRVAGRAVTGSFPLLSGPRREQLSEDGAVTAREQGRFQASRAIDARTFFKVDGELPAEDVTATECASPVASGGCVSATAGPAVVRSEAVAIAIPAPPTLTLSTSGREVRLLQRQLIELRYLPAGSATGSYDWRTWHAVVAFQGWNLIPRDGEAGPAVWKALEKATAPRPWGGLRDGLQLDRNRQVLLLVERGEVRRAIHVSTGAGGATPAGRFSVFRKERNSWSIPFEVWLPWASYFVGGIAFHEYPSVPAYPASHGCVRVPSSEAGIVYTFASYGTTVWVR